MKSYLHLFLIICTLAAYHPLRAETGVGAPAPSPTTVTGTDAMVNWGTVDSVNENQIVIRDQDKVITAYTITDQTKFSNGDIDTIQLGSNVSIQYNPVSRVALQVTPR